MTSQYILIDTEANPIMKFSSRTAREAALKAATRDQRNIVLVDTATGKLHIFEGHREILNPTTLNTYEKNRGITRKPIVRKLCYTNFSRKLNLNNTNDKADIQLFLENNSF